MAKTNVKQKKIKVKNIPGGGIRLNLMLLFLKKTGQVRESPV
ncbi:MULTISPECIES: hypothetical protein [Eubacterium]|nr:MULTISPECIES: hypothetical protein [Eubacterium]